MHDPMQVKSFRTGAVIAAYRIVAYPVSGTVVTADGATTPLLGCTAEVGADEGGMADVAVLGLAEVQFGGDVDAGDPVTSDAQGRAVKAEPAAGTQAFVLGFAIADAVSGDIAGVTLSPFILTGV